MAILGLPDGKWGGKAQNDEQPTLRTVLQTITQTRGWIEEITHFFISVGAVDYYEISAGGPRIGANVYFNKTGQ